MRTGLRPRNAPGSSPALLAGEPNGEVAAAWVVARELMTAYANPNRSAWKAAAENPSPPPAPAPSVRSLYLGALWGSREFLARFDL